MDAGNLPVVCTDDSNKVQVGDDVVAIGNALALEGGLSVTRGIISGPPRPGTEIGTAIETVLQTDAAINPGNSGGPLVDANGCVIGVNTAVASGTGTQPAQNVGFAIPISYAKPVIDDIKAGRKPQSEMKDESKAVADGMIKLDPASVDLNAAASGQ